METRWRSGWILAGLMGLMCPLFAEKDLTAKQLAALARASVCRYRSLEATMEGRGIQYGSPDQDNPVEKYRLTMDYRRAGERIFATVESTYDPDTPQSHSVRKTYGVDSSVGRLLREEPIGYTWFHAQILPRRDLLQQLSWTPDFLIADRIFEDGPATIGPMGRATVSRDPMTACWILEYPMIPDNPKSSWNKITLDPEKEYLAIRKEIRLSDQRVISIDECSDFQKVGGLWFPLRYSWMDPDASFGGRFEYKSVVINEPVSADRLRMDFPSRTSVDDRIRGVYYQINDESFRGGQQTPSGSEVTAGSGPALAAPTSDDELAKAAAIADQLLNKSSAASQLTPVDLSPDYVWVLPGKNQYNLELLGQKSKPVLSGKTISDSPLILHGVDDQLASSGKIIVALERPAGHKAFADAVLMLDFGGVKTPIHFVAAPLP